MFDQKRWLWTGTAPPNVLPDKRNRQASRAVWRVEKPAHSRRDNYVISYQRCNRFNRGRVETADSPAMPNGIAIALGQTADDTIAHRSTFRGREPGMAMIVDAAARFGCRHRFVVTSEDGANLFVCESCGHRTDLLPVHLHATRGEVVAFTRVIARPPAAVTSSRPRRSRSTQRRG
jgi:hypothetical protein